MKAILTNNINDKSQIIADCNHIKIISSNGNSIALEEINGDVVIRNN